MMTSSNGNIFRVTGPLCGEFTGPGEFPTQRPVTRRFDFSLICVWINGWVHNREAGDLRRHRGHYDVIVMVIALFMGLPIRAVFALLHWVQFKIGRCIHYRPYKNCLTKACHTSLLIFDMNWLFQRFRKQGNDSIRTNLSVYQTILLSKLLYKQVKGNIILYYYPLFRVMSWNNGVRCMSFPILILIADIIIYSDSFA